MLSHIVTDLHASYLEEVFKPQLGKPGASAPKAEKSEKGGATKTDSGATSEKRIRQAVYEP